MIGLSGQTGEKEVTMKRFAVTALILFLWINAHIAWATMGIMAFVFISAGGGEAGRAPSQETLHIAVVGFVIGVIMAGLAIVPALLAYNRPAEQRKPFRTWSIGMFANGFLVQLLAWIYFLAT